MNPLLLALIPVIFWDGYFLLNYLLSLRKPYPTREWEPKVSLIIPAYNEGKRVLRAIEAALKQDYPDFEVIVVDDGSEDDTYAVASSVNDPRLKVVRAEHRGKAGALNEGLKLATGEIIATTDADSFLERNALRELVRRFYSEKVLGVGGQVRVMNNSLPELIQDIEHLRIGMFRRAKELDDLSLAPGPIAAFRKKALERIDGFVEDIVEDYATTKAVKEFGKVVYAPKARVWTEMPASLRELWRQRRRWVLGDMKRMGAGFTKDWAFMGFSDIIAALDVILPFSLLFGSLWWALLLWWGFEALSMLVPTVVEGGRLRNALLFPVILWFLASFYLSLHIYGYWMKLAGRL
ncbi:glycosyltransferase [Thermococcus sp.]